MSKRETYTAVVKCPECKIMGHVTYSENENPVHGGELGQKVESVPEGFEIKGGKVFCTKCQKEI